MDRPEPPPDAPAPVILVVDDEELLRMLAVEFFRDAGYEPIEAADGAAALRILESRPDVRAVFTDVQMPGMPDGFAPARDVKGINPDCAVVVVSGRKEPTAGDLPKGVRFLTKPYRGQGIVRLFDEMLDRP